MTEITGKLYGVIKILTLNNMDSMYRTIVVNFEHPSSNNKGGVAVMVLTPLRLLRYRMNCSEKIYFSGNRSGAN